MASATVTGPMLEYISNIEFSLNFEDKRSSVKVRVGGIVSYDGTTAKYTKQPSGEEIIGKTSSLKSAIASNWLTLNVPGAPVGPIDVKTDKIRNEDIVYKPADYDPLKGGSFDELLKKSDDIVVAGTSGSGRQVIAEEDQVVKRTNFDGGPTTTVKRTAKLEVVGDQVNVRETGTTVSNSTSSITQRTSKPRVIQADDGQADHIIVSKKKETSEPTTKAKTFTVDSSTPNIPSDAAGGATMAEIQRVTSPVKFDDQQDARVIRKVGSTGTRMPDEPNEVEGIVLRKTGPVKQSMGSTPVADLSGVKTQSEVDAIEKEIVQKETAAAPKVPVVAKNYVDMLPEDWATLHWVKKEQFINEITDPNFLKFIMRVESIKAVHAACKKRLTELVQKSSANG
jgi:hypothetical protein